VRHVFGSRKRKGASVIALSLVMAMALAACGSSSKGGTKTPDSKPSGATGPFADVGGTAGAALPGLITETAKPAEGGKMTFALDAESTGGWCLAEAQLAAAGIQVARTIYDYLAVPDDKGGYIPSLADKITPNADYTSWTIHLRSGIKFQDGTPLNATVVKNNLDAYRGKYAARSPLLFIFVFDDIKAVTATDDMTVKVDMITPWASFPAHLYEYGRLGMMAQAQLDSGKDCYKKMIGTGPFSLVSWAPNNQLIVKKNPNYWRKDAFGQQLPYLDQITFKPVPDGNQMLNGLKSHAFDLASTDDTTTVIFGVLPDVKSGNLNIAVAAGNPETAYTIFNTMKEPFNNMLAREAYIYAYNKVLYNNVRQHNLNQLANGPFGPGVLGHLDDTGFPEFNLQKAKDLVAQYKSTTGKDLSFTLSIPNDSASQSSAAVVQGMMKQAGITVSLKPEEQSQQINDVIAGSYQAAAWRNHPGFDPDTQWVWWHCNTPAAPAVAPAPASPNIGLKTDAGAVGNNCTNLVNFSKFNDPVINKAFESGRTSTDPAVRKTAYESMNKEFAKQMWEAWGYWSVWTVPSQTNVRGILGPKLPTATSPDVTAEGANPYSGLSSGTDVSGLWIKS
jgi:peptide/nickel transport system substrate-binding protein